MGNKALLLFHGLPVAEVLALLLFRYLVEPPLDSEDPKRFYKYGASIPASIPPISAHHSACSRGQDSTAVLAADLLLGCCCPWVKPRYPFTSCEVFCCEVEAIFNTLLEDAELMKLLFSLLESPAPLSCKTAGYFGRVVGHLLLRKTTEMMQYMQDNPAILDKLIVHVDTTSIADILKRLVGADEQSSMLFLPVYAQWLSETSLVDLLLSRLAQNNSGEAQTNAADILSAIAHTQPSPLASKLTKEESITSLFDHAMAPGKQVLVPALDVCIALVEPRRSSQELPAEGSPSLDNAHKAKLSAVAAIVKHLPKLVDLLQSEESSTQETPYGLLSPPLGRPRLKIVELLAVLVRSGDSTSEAAVVQSGAVRLCLQLFVKYPFNNLLHHSVTAMLVAALTMASSGLLEHLFQDCRLLDWLVSIPVDIKPQPRPGTEEDTASKPQIRAGYLGHVTQIASTLESVASPPSGSQGGAETAAQAQVVSTSCSAHQGWQAYTKDYLHLRQELENTAKWACGRPPAAEIVGLNSDEDEYQVRPPPPQPPHTSAQRWCWFVITDTAAHWTRLPLI